MFLLPCLLAAALLLAIWVAAIGAVCLMGVARLCERLGPAEIGGRGSDANSNVGRRAEELSATDLRFLHECGIEPVPSGKELQPTPALAGGGSADCAASVHGGGAERRL